MMDWGDFLRERGIDPDAVEAGSTINLADNGHNGKQAADQRKAIRRLDSRASKAERLFYEFWQMYGDSSFRMEHDGKGTILVPGRRWRSDFAFPDQKVAVEIEGMFSGSRSQNEHEGRHRSVLGFLADAEKYNAALMEGWLIYRIPTLWLYRGKHYRAKDVCEDLVKLLRQRGGQSESGTPEESAREA